MKSRKLFIGFRIPRMAEKHLREYVVSISDLPFRLTKPENFHVTVLFLGFQSEGGISKISEILSELAEETESFDLFFDRIEFLSESGSEPGPGKILACTGPENIEALSLYNRLRNSLGLSSVPAKRFRPHITLARAKKGFQNDSSEKLKLGNLRRNIAISISELILFESVFSAEDGLKYEIFEEFPFQGG